ncbi:hypothetical protein [Runella sp.]|uniref:hypothetical protein n=1 Tax=Runella sp. TaxID=1960881 RepID=UPI003D13367A
MKQNILLFLALVGIQTVASAQNPEYVKAMEEVVTKIQTAAFEEDLTPQANLLERIAAAEPKEWLPNYWAAYCYTMRSLSEPIADKKDVVLEKAEKLIASAEKLSPNNDEIEVMKATIAGARLAVDPQNRWQKYGQISEEALAAAKKISPENPRAKLLEAQSIFYTPEAYGGGKKKSEPLLKEALEKFAKFKPVSTIHPNWGLSVTQYMLSQI